MQLRNANNYADFEDLEAFAKEQGAPEGENMCLWDIRFWNERIREAKYNINEVPVVVLF